MSEEKSDYYDGDYGFNDPEIDYSKDQDPKLLTLKDLYSESSTWDMGEMVSLKELKAEAVKWVKEITREKYEDINDVPKEVVITALAKDWIKHFFNLTSEDLKDE